MKLTETELLLAIRSNIIDESRLIECTMVDLMNLIKTLDASNDLMDNDTKRRVRTTICIAQMLHPELTLECLLEILHRGTNDENSNIILSSISHQAHKAMLKLKQAKQG